jgi:hypothetical protein
LRHWLLECKGNFIRASAVHGPNPVISMFILREGSAEAEGADLRRPESRRTHTADRTAARDGAPNDDPLIPTKPLNATL